MERKAFWRDALAALGYGIEEGPPPDGLMSSGRVQHRLLRPEESTAPAKAGELHPRWAEAADAFRRAARSAAKSARPPIRRPSGEHDEKAAGASVSRGDEEVGFAARPRRAAPGVARTAGELVHSVLERCPFDAWDRIPEILAQEAARLARSEKLSARAAIDKARAEAEEILEAFRASPLPARLASVEVLGRELPILFRAPVLLQPDAEADGPAWLGSCDLVYRDAGGRIVVADYKTDKVQGDPAEHAGRYADQIALYMQAIRAALPGEEVRGEILFVRTGAIVPF